MTLLHSIEAVVGLGLASLVAWRLCRLPQVLAARPQALLSQPAPLPPTGHMVFASSPLQFNEHGFITTPSVPCTDPACLCRTMPP